MNNVISIEPSRVKKIGNKVKRAGKVTGNFFCSGAKSIKNHTFNLILKVKTTIKERKEVNQMASEMAGALKESMNKAELKQTAKELRRQADILEALLRG
jgi:hypothetical protein